jgi:periplasmic protein TonB
MTLIRIPFAFVCGLAFTGGVFWGLWALINGPVQFSDLKPAVRIEFTRLRHDSEAESKRQEKVERQKPVQTPDMPQIAMGASSAPGDSVSMLNPNVDTRGAMSGMKISAGSDRDIVPLVRIPPEYPARAQQRGIEGWVMVEFTISPSGTVLDPKVLDADPKGIFDDAALKSISRWKYNPKVENGVAVERRGIRVVLRFDLED